VELLLRREKYDGLADLLLGPGEVLHAPHLVDVEVTQVLRRLEQAGTLTTSRAEEARDDFRALRLVLHDHRPLLDRVWVLRHNLSAYDGLYVALAEALEARLVTTDGRMAEAPGHGAEVVVAT
jgi:predicted nucleic acid-binding protein